MSETNERSVASAGSVAGKPVAWAALRDDGDIAWIGYTPDGAADAACGRRIVPLYRQPQRDMNTIDPSAYEGDIISRLRNWRGLHLAHGGILFEEAADEIARLRLTDAEREAVEAVLDDPDLVLGDAREPLRGLLDRLSPIDTAESDRPKAIATPEPSSTPAECSVPPEWISRPYWVDPPEGWRWGFPRLYDPAKDGNMTEWMIRNGYPERLARQGLPCTFTACTDAEEARKMLAIRDGVSARAQTGGK